MLKPPERLTVSQAAERYVRLHNPGSYIGPFLNSITPYIVEPQDEMTNPDFSGIIFVGPAQSGKTAMLLNWMAYSIKSDPMDMILYSPSQANARDFSNRRVDRMHRHSPEIGALMRTERDADNKFDKHYKNGMLVTLSWPSSSEMAGKPIPRVALTDYDRMDEDVDGEGSPFDLASKRTTTFGTFAKTVAESSPSRSLENPRWIATSAHEAPPTTGILALYNRGDKRRWYWPCPHCDNYFEGNFKNLEWDDMGDHLATAETVRMVCPICNEKISPDERGDMNAAGRWIKDGMAFDHATGKLLGTGMRASIASFWLKGVAASFVTWKKLVEGYLVAESEYEKTGSEETLKKFYNTDLSEIYFPKSLESERIPEHLKARAERMPEKEVPDNVRLLVATIDVQANMFICQIHGILPGRPFDMVLIDRYQIRKSKRKDEQGDAEWVKPGTYEEDWDELIEHAMEKQYPLSDGSGRTMGIKMTVCDSGGKEGVTGNAYAFFRRLRAAGKSGRFRLVKGEGVAGQQRVRETFPDAQKKDKYAVARGDVPVLILNSNLLKDMLSHRLESLEPGKGMYRFPDWLPDWWFVEMCAERRTDKGWVNTVHTRNEAWDLSYYCIAICISKHLNLENINWDNPPAWAAPWETNDLISEKNAGIRFALPKDNIYDFKKLAETLG